MIDVGEDIKVHKNNKVERKMANALLKNAPDMLQKWTVDNFHNFEETMEMIRDGAPVQYVRLYLQAVQLGLVKNTNINVNLNINRQQDRENLQALVRAREHHALTDAGSYIPYEEVKPQPLPLKKEDY